MQDNNGTEVVEQYDVMQSLTDEEEYLKQEGYVKPQFSTYNEVVKLYRDVIKEGYDYDQMIAAGLTNMEISRLAYNDSNDALSRFGYCYMDLDNDGKDELIIGKENSVYEMYSQKNEIEKIFECTNYRASAWLINDNTLVWMATGGAGYHDFYHFQLENGNWKTIESLNIDTRANPEDENKYDKYNQLVDEYTEKKLPLTFTPFSEVQ